jgi:alanyl-tRNA synthetase
MTPHALREAWLSFFEAAGHTRWPSASLVPEHDPTLLFTGAGMNQFKDMFLGKGNLPFRRATTVQRCFRQGDLENVGRTPRHLTFFEMLGHFSFGDYFKRESIAWAWEFLTRRVSIPADRLRVSVYREDDEALAAWRAIGVPSDRIARFDARENFWPANAPEDGPNGPCGPCSEIFFDYGEEAEKGDGGPASYDSGRWVEIWNMVFTQFDRRGVNDLAPLPQRNIDTGAGFERILAAMADQRSPFSTALFRPIVERIASLAGVGYDFEAPGGMPSGPQAVRVRRIADHARAASMIVADGVKPSNEGRGYVLRRVLRRAIRDGIQLGIDEPFLARLVDPVVGTMADGYPHLREGVPVLTAVLEGEERRFRETYATGSRYLEEEIARLGSARTLPGPVAFRLYDTYGFPLDLAEVILEERGISVDRAGFDREMEAQRERARKGSKLRGDIFAAGPLTELKSRGVAATRFTGYEGAGTRGRSVVRGICLEDHRLVPAADEGTRASLVLEESPFYAEAGGQVGDAGEIVTPSGRFAVEDTQRLEGFVLHLGRVTQGRVAEGEAAELLVDAERRDAIRRNHTATHLLHRVLRHLLGDHARQEGSLVAPDRLRFDFAYPRAVEAETLRRIESLVNDWVLRNEPVGTEVMDLERAKAGGAVAMFGEKYDSVVRVLEIPGPGSVGGASRELCGGTHCRRTGDIGSFRITSESSIAAGVRRIEAVTGTGAAQAAGEDRRVVEDLATLVKARPGELVERIQGILEEARELKRAAERARQEAGVAAADRLAAEAPSAGGRRFLVASVPGADAKALKEAWERLRKSGVSAALLAGEAEGKVPLLAAVETSVAGKVDARAILAAATEHLGGRGGGKPDQAQGQGLDASKIAPALAAARRRLEEALTAAGA